jgi:hypothetical protein
MAILSNDKYSSVISWKANGRGFIINKKEQFSNEILPLYFPNQSKYSSFTRRLSRWGFHRVRSGVDMGVYHHPLFRKGDYGLCLQMHCVKRLPKDDLNDPDFYTEDDTTLCLYDDPTAAVMKVYSRANKSAGLPIKAKDYIDPERRIESRTETGVSSRGTSRSNGNQNSNSNVNFGPEGVEEECNSMDLTTALLLNLLLQQRQATNIATTSPPFAITAGSPSALAVLLQQYHPQQQFVVIPTQNPAATISLLNFNANNPRATLLSHNQDGQNLHFGANSHTIGSMPVATNSFPPMIQDSTFMSNIPRDAISPTNSKRRKHKRELLSMSKCSDPSIGAVSIRSDHAIGEKRRRTVTSTKNESFTAKQVDIDPSQR